MYTPAFNSMSADNVVTALRSIRFGHLVTHSEGLQSTALPFVVDDDVTTVRAHFARANQHWSTIDEAEALLIVPGVDGYISPRWYPSKAETTKVVPTWNYELIHLHGTVEIHDDPAWKLDLVSQLTDENEADDPTSTPWQVTDAPADFVAKQLNAIVGVQLNVSRIEGKEKLSQNKTDADRLGAAEGVASTTRLGGRQLGAAMGDRES